MSRLNKVNRDRYTTGGRLTPDEMARERQKQAPPPKADASATRPAGKKKTATEKRSPR